jgi:hypothetical protein
MLSQAVSDASGQPNLEEDLDWGDRSDGSAQGEASSR